MFTAWWISSIIIAAISLVIIITNVCIGYSDGWVTEDGKAFIRYGVLGLLASPTGFFVVPLAVLFGAIWLLLKIIMGVIVFGFVKEVPIDDETGQPKKKYPSDGGMYY